MSTKRGFTSFFDPYSGLFILLVIILAFILPQMINILLLFFGAYVIACALNPFVLKLTKKMNRTAASTIVMGISLLSITALFVPIIAVAIKEIRVFMLTLPDKITGVYDYLLNAQLYGHKFTDMIDLDTVIGNSSNFAKDVLNHSLNITVGLAQLIVILIAMTMIVYYILADKEYLKTKFLQFFPPDLKNKAESILSNISTKVGAYVRAQLLSMAAVGVMVAIVLVIFGVDYATLLGLISGILDIIPILGPSIALGVILLVAYPLGIVKIIFIILGFLLCQQLSNYVIKPLLFGKMMKMHPLMIFLALFVANQFLGFWGVILSPAIAATLCVLIDELYLNPINIKGEDA